MLILECFEQNAYCLCVWLQDVFSNIIAYSNFLIHLIKIT